jgi:DNA repair exonuclease SbcCD ATPase subunit
MKNKIVLWGTNEQNDRVLIAMELKPRENKVDIFTIPENIATEEFSKQMMDEWRDNKPFELPEGFTRIERELTVADSLLPDHLKVERSDIINRAQTEWHFTVLSTKLHETYKAELHDLKDKIEALRDYDANVWDELKAFWDKVQNQVRERNIFREQADMLRDTANELFTKLKLLRTQLDDNFKSKSKDNFDKLHTLIEDIEQRAAKGLRLQPLFDELKQLQQQFKELEFTRDDRNKIWNRIDAAFKNMKTIRSGGNSNAGNSDENPLERIKKRYDGLISAIYKMEESIKRDKQELDFQSQKIASTDGQLEAQIRQAKIKMVEERLNSKQAKLNEMTATQTDLERRMKSLEERDQRREKVEEAKKAAESKIKDEIAAAAQAREEDTDKLEKAALSLKHNKAEQGESLLDAAGTLIGEVLLDALDTAKAIAEVASDKLEDIGEDIKEKAEDKVEDLREMAAGLGDQIKEKVADIRNEVESIGNSIEMPEHQDPASAPDTDSGIQHQDVAPSIPEAPEANEEKLS